MSGSDPAGGCDILAPDWNGCSDCLMSEERLVSGGLKRDERENAALRPKYLREMVGQDRVRENLSIIIEAARMRKEPLDHTLFYGPPGLGKTSLAHVMANEMATNIRITSGPSIERAGDLAAILTNLKAGDILFIDEVHRLGRAVEEILYPAMEDFALDIVIGKGPAAKNVRLRLPRFTVIGATTQSSALGGPTARPLRRAVPPRLLRPARAGTHHPAGRRNAARRREAARPQRDCAPFTRDAAYRPATAAPRARLRPNPRRRHHHRPGRWRSARTT